jgi:uncharacterized protein YndB with AHSA1/START domain
MSEAPVIEIVRKSVTVDCTVEEAFRIFTADAISWWPVESHSIHQTVDAIVFEPGVGGEVYEISASGERGHWATVLVLQWDPPSRLVLAWNIRNAEQEPTEVEIRFVPDSAGTRVELEHRGWDPLGDGAAEKRASYDSGWDVVLGTPSWISSRTSSGRRRGAKVAYVSSSSGSVHHRMSVIPSARSASQGRAGLGSKAAMRTRYTRSSSPSHCASPDQNGALRIHTSGPSSKPSSPVSSRSSLRTASSFALLDAAAGCDPQPWLVSSHADQEDAVALVEHQRARPHAKAELAHETSR